MSKAQRGHETANLAQSCEVCTTPTILGVRNADPLPTYQWRKGSLLHQINHSHNLLHDFIPWLYDSIIGKFSVRVVEF